MDYHKHAAEFSERGFTILPGFYTEAEMAELKTQLLDAAERRKSECVLDKGGMLFFENMYRYSDHVRSFISDQRIVDVLNHLFVPDTWCRWDQVVFKHPGGAAFPWHQDNSYNELLDTHLQFWVGLTEMNEENGGLWVAPGSHKLGHLPHHREGTHAVCDHEVKHAQFVPTKVGDVVCFSSLMLHHTKENRSDKDRIAYVVEYMSLQHYDHYVEPPFFITSRNGQRVGRFEDSYPGRSRLSASRMRHSAHEYRKRAGSLAKRVARVFG
jgi:ectoine hydroxylase-related dioxygenase (phytanoyl-CoA dioxygenase family)